MLGFSNIRSVSDVDFIEKSITFMWRGSSLDFKQSGYSDCVDCARLLCVVSDVISSDFRVRLVDSERVLLSDEFNSLSDDCEVYAFVIVKFV